MEKTTALYNELLTAFQAMDDSDIVSIWNEYCLVSSYYEDQIMDSYGLEEMLTGQDIFYIANRFYFGTDEGIENTSANPNRNYFQFDGYGNITSFDYIYNSYSKEFSYIDIESLINYIIDNEEAFYNDDIQEIIDNMQE